MANRFFNPNEQFCDGNGLPYAGGSLSFYASGTSTPLNTYSDSALSIPNTNPVVLDSAGRANSIFLQNLAYKVVLADVNNNQIWTEDPVYASDYSTRAKLNSGAGSPNGFVAGTAGSAGIGADTYWDNVNDILYVCTQTGTASTAVWTAINSGAATAVVVPPQGYLTLVSGTPVIANDAVAATAIIYTPFMGNLVPIFSGSSFVPIVFSELTLTLTSGQAANTIYDVFIFNNAGSLTLVTGPAWQNSGAGAGARGTGAGTTQLSRLNGLWVNTVQISGKNGGNTYTIPANQATYLGSIFIDASAGQVSCYRSYGQSRKWGVWNAYNRVPIIMQAGDSTSSWVYSTGSVRPSNNNTANSITTFAGLAEEVISVTFNQVVTGTSALANTSTAVGQLGIGWDSTTNFSGGGGKSGFTLQVTSSEFVNETTSTAQYNPAIGIGTNVATSLETALNINSASLTWFGTVNNMILQTTYRG
jgi:hypothetical protein